MSTPSVEPRHLRSALQFAVDIAREGQKRKPPIKYPAGLKRYLQMPRLPKEALSGVRRVIEADEAFRSLIAKAATPELVDAVGLVWLSRQEGWEAELARLAAAADAEAVEADKALALKRAEKRLVAAEQAAARARVEVLALQERLSEHQVVIDGLRSDVVKYTDTIDELQVQLADTRLEARHARDREAAALAKLATALGARDEAVAAQGAAEVVRDHVLADRSTLAAERSELARLAASASALADQLASLATPAAPGKPKESKRKAMPLPGGVMGGSHTAAEYLLRSGASVLVDGYNVAKLAWPGLDCAGQRVVLLDAIENLARRFGSDITVVFDGAEVIGAVADRRRVVRVVFSPKDVIADDVIRDEVRRLPATRQVVVVTNDQQIVRDVRAMGANTISSEQLLALMH
jgi:predicted RNA-binding protein with PIN domain